MFELLRIHTTVWLSVKNISAGAEEIQIIIIYRWAICTERPEQCNIISYRRKPTHEIFKAVMQTTRREVTRTAAVVWPNSEIMRLEKAQGFILAHHRITAITANVKTGGKSTKAVWKYQSSSICLLKACALSKWFYSKDFGKNSLRITNYHVYLHALSALC